jgi:NAD dependent epimerase/dehydratase family enzyme
LSWITLADEVSVILRALTDADLTGPLNATAPEPVRNEEFTRTLGAVLHRPTLLAVPRLALAGVLGPELASELLLASQRVLPVRLEAVGYRFAHPDLRSALSAVLA